MRRGIRSSEKLFKMVATATTKIGEIEHFVIGPLGFGVVGTNLSIEMGISPSATIGLTIKKIGPAGQVNTNDPILVAVADVLRKIDEVALRMSQSLGWQLSSIDLNIGLSMTSALSVSLSVARIEYNQPPGPTVHGEAASQPPMRQPEPQPHEPRSPPPSPLQPPPVHASSPQTPIPPPCPPQLQPMQPQPANREWRAEQPSYRGTAGPHDGSPLDSRGRERDFSGPYREPPAYEHGRLYGPPHQSGPYREPPTQEPQTTYDQPHDPRARHHVPQRQDGWQAHDQSYHQPAPSYEYYQDPVCDRRSAHLDQDQDNGANQSGIEGNREDETQPHGGNVHLKNEIDMIFSFEDEDECE